MLVSQPWPCGIQSNGSDPLCRRAHGSRTHNYFAHSSCRQKAYKKLHDSMTTNCEEKDPPKVLALSQTRCLAIADCIERILAQFDNLAGFFTKAEDHNYDNSILREMYWDPKNYAYLVFLASFLHRVKRVNIMFQSNVSDPLALFQELENLYLDTLKRILIPSVVRHIRSTSLLSLELVNMRYIFLGPETTDLGDFFSEKLSKLPIEDKKNMFANAAFIS